jgi:hypothetical protein
MLQKLLWFGITNFLCYQRISTKPSTGIIAQGLWMAPACLVGPCHTSGNGREQSRQTPWFMKKQGQNLTQATIVGIHAETYGKNVMCQIGT